MKQQVAERLVKRFIVHKLDLLAIDSPVATQGTEVVVVLASDYDTLQAQLAQVRDDYWHHIELEYELEEQLVQVQQELKEWKAMNHADVIDRQAKMIQGLNTRLLTATGLLEKVHAMFLHTAEYCDDCETGEPCEKYVELHGDASEAIRHHLDAKE
jgi:hypothetical protein